LENFFGLKRRQSFEDDRSVRRARIIARNVFVANVRHNVGLNLVHRRQDNMGGAVISGSLPEFTDEVADQLFRSFVAH
jgi:methylmalonyl-CoA mutase cobalamin-binding subunit